MRTYSTNEICKLCDVSRKQLRYYEERGLLSSVPRDEGNNYRYYTSEHIYEIVAAKALRRIDMPLSEMKDLIYGNNVGHIQLSLQRQIDSARDNLENSLRQYEQSVRVYTRLVEALSLLRLHSGGGGELPIEMVDCARRDIISLSYSTTFEDEFYDDVDYIPRIQSIAQSVNAVSVDSLVYMTYDHFDSDTHVFDGGVHSFKIGIPVADRKRPCANYDFIPAFRGVSTFHIGSPKGKRLHDSYIRLFRWAEQRGCRLESWSVEDWLISPMITNNKELWVIQIIVPIRE